MRTYSSAPSFILLSFLMLIAGMKQGLFAQRANQFFDRYTTTDGLSHNSVNDLAKDRDGFLWIATSQGLNRFDGVHFNTWFHEPDDTTSLPGNVINALLFDPKNRLWIGTLGDGIALRNAETGAFKHYRLPSAGYSLRSSNKVEDLFWFDNTVIATCFSGSFYYDESQDRFRVLNDGFVEHAEIDFGMQAVITPDTINHGLWFRCMKEYYFIQEKTHQVLSKTNNPHNWKVFDFYIRSTPVVDKNGNLWFQDWDDELLKSFSPKTGEIRSYALTEILRGNDRYYNIVSRILCDKHNHLWFIRNNPVQLRFHPESGTDSTLFAFDYPGALGNGQVNEILSGEDDGLFVGTVNGLFVQRKNSIPLNLYLAPEEERIIFAHQGTRTIALFGRAVILLVNPNSHEKIRKVRYDELGINEPIQRCFEYGTDQVLVQTTGENLWLVNTDPLQIAPTSLQFMSALSDESDAIITELILDGTDLWAALSPFTIVHENSSTGEIHSWSPAMAAPYDIPANHIQALQYTPRHGLIVAFGGGKGVYRLNTATQKMEGWLTPGTLYGDHILPDAAILCMHMHSNGVLYLALEGKGLYAYDGQHLLRFDRSSGLFSESIHKIKAVSEDLIALFHNSGIVQMNVHSNTFQTALHQESNYHTFLQESGVSAPKNGSLVYFYQNCVYTLDFTQGTNNEAPSIPCVTGFKVFDTTRSVGIPPDEISLNYSENFFTFSLSAFEFSKSNKPELSFKLEGFDPDWRMAEVSSEAAYTNVPPGKYTFLVRARSSGEDWGMPRSYRIVIHPPYWQTWWFRLLILITVCALLYGFYRYRLAQVIKLQAVRNKIASDLHDDVGSTLSSINIFSKFARDHLQKNPAETDELLKRINNSTVKMMDNMSDIVWSINPQNDTLKSLVARIRSHAAEVLGSMGITTEVDQLIDEDLQLNMTSRKNIFLIAKEAINNIAKHSGATKASFSFKSENGWLTIAISDNGKESEIAADNKGGNGARTMRARAKELDAEVEIASSMKEIVIRIPQKKIKL